MSDDSYSRNVELVCPTCGGSQFEHDDDIETSTAEVRCIGCNTRMTKEDLIAANAENIEEHVKEIGDEVVKDAQKRLKQAFKRFGK